MADNSDNEEFGNNSMDSDDSSHKQQEEQDHSEAAAATPKTPQLERVEGGFWCSKCNKTIKGPPQKFKRHYVEMHGLDSSDKLFCCGRCKRKYKSARSLTRHLNNLHKNEHRVTPHAKKIAGKWKETTKPGQLQSAEEITVQANSSDAATAASAAAASTSEPKPSLKRQATIDLTDESPIKKKIKEEPKPEPELKQDVLKKQDKKRDKSNAKEKDTIEDDSELVEAEEQAKIVLAQAEAEMKVRKEMVVSREEVNARAATDYAIAQQKAKNEAAIDYAVAQQKAKNEATMDYAVAQQKAKNKIRMQAALAVVQDRAKGKLAKAREELDKIQRKMKEKVTLGKRAVTDDLSSDDDDDDARPKKKRDKQNVIDDNDDEEEAEMMDDDNLPIMESNDTVSQSPIPEVIQISGPHLNDIQAGNDPFASIPTDYSAADNVLKQKFAAAAAAAAAAGRAVGASSAGDAAGGIVGGAAGGTGTSSTSELGRLERTSTNERNQVAYGEERDRHTKETNRTIASDHCLRTLIGFKDKERRSWTDVFSFFACIALFQHNKFDSDNLVYIREKKVKSTAKKLIKPAKRYLRSKGVHLMKNGKMDLHAIRPHLSNFYKIIINVYSERKVNLTCDGRLFFDEYKSWPVLHLLRSETGRFCVIKDILAFDRVIRCHQCRRKFNKKSNLNRHLTGDRCPFDKFLEKCGIERTGEFFRTPPEEYMVKHYFPGGKVKPKLKIKENLEKFGIRLDVDFVFNPYYAVSDIETFLVQMIHKTIDGEEKIISANDKLLFYNHHDPACVSIISNLGGKYSYCQNFMCADTNTSKFIHVYVQYLKEMSDLQFGLLMDKHKRIFDDLDNVKLYAEMDNKMGLITAVDALIKQMRVEAKKLQVFFFNSVFDLNCLVRHGLCYFIQEISGERPRAIKNGNDYICLNGTFVVFKDILKFTAAKVSLPAFLYTYQVPDRYSKMAFPYEILTSPSALMTPLPIPYENFYSKLRRENTLEAPRAKYLSLMANGLSKEDALKEMKMREEPLTGQEMYEYINDLCERKNIHYLYQYLALYCDMDCVGLMVGIGYMRDSFKLLTGLDMFDFLTLPSMAFNWALREVGEYHEPTLNHFVKLGEKAYNLILPGLRGGATMIGNRLSVAGITTIKPHEFPPEQQKVVKKQLYLDANALYGGTCKMDNPVLGSYAIRHKKDKFLFNKIQEKGLGALSWLMYRSKMVECQEIRTIRSINSEKTIILQDKSRARLDGWINVVRDPVSGHMKGVSFEFHDFTHSHPSDPWFRNKPPDEFENGINPITKKPHKESYERTLARDDMIRQHPDIIEHHVMWSYRWDEKIDGNPDLFEFVKECILREGPDPIEMECTWERMLELILEERIHGLVQCSLNTPQHLIKKFSIFPPFFNHKRLGRNDCAPVEKSYAEKHDLLKLPQRILTNELRVEDTVISTDLLRFYVHDLELEVTNIETVVQFKGAAKVLENMLEKCKQYRDEGVRTGAPVKKEIGKLLLNGFYGSSILNMEHRRSTVYVKRKNLRHYANRPETASSAFAGPSWDPGRLAEVEMRKFKVSQISPKQLGIWILNASKMVLLRFIYHVLYRYLDPASWEINGLDTDGIIISIAGDDLVSICKPHLVDEFKDKYKSIFAVDKDQTHVPHLFKTEKESVIFIGLATKSYFMLNLDSPIGKIATKGIPNRTEENENLVGLLNFLRTLFDIHTGAPPTAIVRGIRCDQFKNMATYVQMKRGLSRMAAKQGFHSCAIHYYPLELKDDAETLNELYPYTDNCQCYDMEAVCQQIKQLSEQYPKMKLVIPDSLMSDIISMTKQTLDRQ